jgi:uncharacterized protein (DUF486 family)
MTASTLQLNALLNIYFRFFPSWTFPFLPLTIAAFFQSIAWMAGTIFLYDLSLLPRMLVLWLFAAGEYLFMSPTMNAGIEILNMEEPFLVVIYQIITLVVYMNVHVFVFNKTFKFKYFISFLFLALATYFAYM